MSKLGFYYNMNRCAGCMACQVACKNKHALKAGEFFRRVEMTEFGPYSGACNHCSEAACVKACPTGAMYKAQDGTTQHHDGLCIGCGSCMWNCPYGAISFSKSRGLAQKCDSCIDNREQGLEPACLKACPTKALRFGDIEDPESLGLCQEDQEALVLDLSFLAPCTKTEPALIITPSKRYKDNVASHKGGSKHE